MRVLEKVPGKYLLPLAAVFGTVVGLGALPAHAAGPGSIEVVTGADGTGEACTFHVFAQGFQEGQELRFTVHHHPGDGEVVLEGSFGIGANGHGRSPATGEHALPNGAYELHLIASPPGKTPPHPDEYGKAEPHGARTAAAAGVSDAKFPADGDRTAALFHDQFSRVFELACEDAEPKAPPAPEEPTSPGTQEEPVEVPVAHEPGTPEEGRTPTVQEPARPEQPEQPEYRPQELREPEQAHQPELPRTGVTITKLLAGGVGLMLIGAFLVASTVHRRVS